jgi:sigma-B regulation protein RsbU (phosphoserine phosphatase)
MEAYLDTAPCCYFSFRDDGTLYKVNKTLCENLGYSIEELQEQKIELIFTIPTKIFYQTHFFPLLKLQGRAEEIYITLQTKNKDHLPILVNANRGVANGEALNTCVGIIVHNRKKFEDELINAKKTMEAAMRENTELSKAREELQRHTERLDETLFRVKNQNTELRQFNRVVTHDLQEPIRKLTFFSNELLEELGELSGRVPAKIKKLMKVSGQMRSIVSGLQQYVWLNESIPEFTVVDLNKLLLAVQQDLKTEYDEALWKINADNLPPVQGNWEQLRLLLMYILSNAIRYKKEETTCSINITSTVLMQNAFRSMHEKYKYRDYLKLQIMDNGIGFEAIYKEHVFELFKKLHNGPGRGLGLALSKKIVDNHHGMIEADAIPGQGATFTIFLPMQRDLQMHE